MAVPVYESETSVANTTIRAVPLGDYDFTLPTSNVGDLRVVIVMTEGGNDNMFSPDLLRPTGWEWMPHLGSENGESSGNVTQVSWRGIYRVKQSGDSDTLTLNTTGETGSFNARIIDRVCSGHRNRRFRSCRG